MLLVCSESSFILFECKNVSLVRICSATFSFIGNVLIDFVFYRGASHVHHVFLICWSWQLFHYSSFCCYWFQYKYIWWTSLVKINFIQGNRKENTRVRVLLSRLTLFKFCFKNHYYRGNDHYLYNFSLLAKFK